MFKYIRTETMICNSIAKTFVCFVGMRRTLLYLNGDGLPRWFDCSPLALHLKTKPINYAPENWLTSIPISATWLRLTHFRGEGSEGKGRAKQRKAKPLCVFTKPTLVQAPLPACMTLKGEELVSLPFFPSNVVRNKYLFFGSTFDTESVSSVHRRNVASVLREEFSDLPFFALSSAAHHSFTYSDQSVGEATYHVLALPEYVWRWFWKSIRVNVDDFWTCHWRWKRTNNEFKHIPGACTVICKLKWRKSSINLNVEFYWKSRLFIRDDSLISQLKTLLTGGHRMDIEMRTKWSSKEM